MTNGCRQPAPTGPVKTAPLSPSRIQIDDRVNRDNVGTDGNARSAITKDPRITDLYRCWFASPYQYMFKPEDDELGMFMAGSRGILFYGSLASCMGEMTGVDNQRFSDLSRIARFAGIAVLSSEGKFRSFNPEIIRWGYEHLIPAPSTEVGGGTAQQRYERQFTRFFRMMAEVYLTLLKNDKSKNNYDSEQLAYRQAIDEDQDGLSYLSKRYAGWLPDYDVQRDWVSLTVPMAIGFWLRRGIDGTRGELWIGLKKVLRLYDGTFYMDLQKRYPTVRVDW